MSDIKLFRTTSESVRQLEGKSVALEKSLQLLMERNLEVFLGIRYLATEYSTGKTHGGRIDTLGLDENGCPCIIEYKRNRNENVINQGLFYLNWLLDHQGEFELLVLKTLGQKIADMIEWSNPRVLCIAGDFTKYDGHAVQQMGRNIELLRYRRYGEDLLLLELLNVPPNSPISRSTTTVATGPTTYKTITEYLADADDQLADLYQAVQALCLAFGDDVQEKTLKYYVAFKRLKNFACVEVRVSTGELRIFVKVDPDQVTLEEGFTRDVRNIGHFGTGELEITIRNHDDIEKATPLIERSYEAS